MSDFDRRVSNFRLIMMSLMFFFSCYAIGAALFMVVGMSDYLYARYHVPVSYPLVRVVLGGVFFALFLSGVICSAIGCAQAEQLVRFRDRVK